MRAMTINSFGGSEVLSLQDVPDPRPGDHDLLIEVRAAALNPIDFKIRKGAFAKGRPFPIILGFDVSGVVRAAGSKAQGFSTADEVYASPSLVRNGSNAELVCVDARTAAPKPRSIDHEQAAALPLVTITAWEALYERAQLAAGRDVLVQGGGGGVGHVAVQLAKQRGCRVLATASRDDSTALCRACGADVVIDYTKEDIVERVLAETDGKGCPVVFDCVGDKVFDLSTRCVAVNGQMVTCAGSGNGDSMRELFTRNASLHFEFMGAPTMYGIEPERQGRILCEAAGLVDAGDLKPHVCRVVKLEDLADGHQLQESGHAAGKIVVRMG